jgi:hypothetical protein
VPTTWPGDNTPYRIQITGTGDRAGFEAAVDDLKARIDRDDLLLIHINNHGDVEGDPGEACWCTWPNEDPYFAGDFSSKLGELPKFGKLVCMFEPCHAGGFNAPVIAQSPAGSTSVASAATVDRESIGSSDLNWDCFARDWIAAQAGHDPYGATLAFNPDGDHEYYELLRMAQPDLVKPSQEIDGRSAELRSEYEPRLEGRDPGSVRRPLKGSLAGPRSPAHEGSLALAG